MLKDEIRAAISSRGSDGYASLVESLVKKKKMAPEEFSIKAMHEAFIEEKGGFRFPGDRITRIKEAVDSTAFAKATGALINKKVIDAYELADTVGDQLVTIIPSSLREETIVGFNALDTPEEVGEGMPYPDSSTAEKYVVIKNKKYGRILTITEETIMFDQTGQILVRAGSLGEKAALYREKMIIEAVTEITSNIYRPSGSATTFYAAGNSNLQTSCAFNTAGLNTVINSLAEFTDENSDPIIIPKPWQLFVPSELIPNAMGMYLSERDPDTAENEANIHRNSFQPLTSPFLTSSTDWWLGNFKKAFAWTQVYPLQVLSRPAGHEMDFHRDIRYAFKVRFYGGAGGLDVHYVVEANA